MPTNARLLSVIADVAASQNRRVLQELAIGTASIIAETATDEGARAAALSMAEKPSSKRFYIENWPARPA